MPIAHEVGKTLGLNENADETNADEGSKKTIVLECIFWRFLFYEYFNHNRKLHRENNLNQIGYENRSCL